MTVNLTPLDDVISATLITTHVLCVEPARSESVPHRSYEIQRSIAHDRGVRLITSSRIIYSRRELQYVTPGFSNNEKKYGNSCICVRDTDIVFTVFVSLIAFGLRTGSTGSSRQRKSKAIGYPTTIASLHRWERYKNHLTQPWKVLTWVGSIDDHEGRWPRIWASIALRCACFLTR